MEYGIYINFLPLKLWDNQKDEKGNLLRKLDHDDIILISIIRTYSQSNKLKLETDNGFIWLNHDWLLRQFPYFGIKKQALQKKLKHLYDRHILLRKTKIAANHKKKAFYKLSSYYWEADDYQSRKISIVTDNTLTEKRKAELFSQLECPEIPNADNRKKTKNRTSGRFNKVKNYRIDNLQSVKVKNYSKPCGKKIPLNKKININSEQEMNSSSNYLNIMKINSMSSWKILKNKKTALINNLEWNYVKYVYEKTEKKGAGYFITALESNEYKTEYSAIQQEKKYYAQRIDEQKKENAVLLEKRMRIQDYIQTIAKAEKTQILDIIMSELNKFEFDMIARSPYRKELLEEKLIDYLMNRKESINYK